MSRTRLLVAQGPTQLLAGLTVWAWEDAITPRAEGEMESIILLGDFFAGRPPHAWTRFAGTWLRRTKAGKSSRHTRWMRGFMSGAISFEQYLDQLREAVRRPWVDEVFVCRNMQLLNEAVLYAFPGARKVCYGDGLGVIDLNGTSFCQPLRQGGYVPVDEIACVMPVEATPGIFSRVPVKTVPLEYFRQTVLAASQRIGAMNGLGLSGGHGRVEDCLLVCLSNLTESGLTERRERELEFYLECLKPFLQREQTVLVKGHPRETLGQSDEVASMIRELGFDSRSLGTANVVPTECLAATLPVSCLVSLISNVPTTWRLLNPRTTLIVGVEPELVGRYLSAAGRKMFSLDLNDSMIFLLTSQATRGAFTPVCLSAIEEHSALAPRAPIRMDGADSFYFGENDAGRRNDVGEEFVNRVLESSKAMFAAGVSPVTRIDGAEEFSSRRRINRLLSSPMRKLKRKLQELFGGQGVRSFPSAAGREARAGRKSRRGKSE